MKTNTCNTEKPKSLSQEEFDLMEKIALYFEQNKLNELDDLLLEEGEYSIPGTRHSIGATKTQFLKYFQMELDYFQKIYRDKITHHYSVCDFCIFGHVVLKFSKSISREAFLNWGTAFRIGIKDGKVNLMEVCFNDIERGITTKERKPVTNEDDFEPEILEPYTKEDELIRNSYDLHQRLEYALKYLELGLYKYFKKEMIAVNKLTVNNPCEGFLSIDVIENLFQNPELLEIEKEEIAKDIEYWEKYFYDTWNKERLEKYGDFPGFDDDDDFDFDGFNESVKIM